MLARSSLIGFMLFAIIGGPNPPPPPPPPPPPSVVPGIQALPPAMPMMPGIAATPLMICAFCQDNGNENDVRACKRLAEADRKVTKASKKVAPGEPNDFARGMAAARACGGAARGPGETAAGCDTWRAAVKKRAKACTFLETQRTAVPPKPAAGADGSKLPVIKVGAAERVAPLGQKLELVGVVGTVENVPKVLVNGETVELVEAPGGGASAGPVNRGFKISVPTAQAGTNIYVIEACDGADNCFGRDLVVRVLAQDGPAAKGQN
ncbi:MAG: hypothetical protein ACYC1L_13865 [Alphaproteobacteria bacterium]